MQSSHLKQPTVTRKWLPSLSLGNDFWSRKWMQELPEAEVTATAGSCSELPVRPSIWRKILFLFKLLFFCTTQTNQELRQSCVFSSLAVTSTHDTGTSRLTQQTIHPQNLASIWVSDFQGTGSRKLHNALMIATTGLRFGKSTHLSIISNSVTHLRSYTNSAITDITGNSTPISPVTPNGAPM